ncbi:glycosyltransferase family 4 protein [soil metagenome]
MKALFYNHTGHVSGAERVILLALAGLERDRIQATVVSPRGPLTGELDDLGIPCLEIGELNARFTIRPDRLLSYAASLIRIVVDLRSKILISDPDVIHANSIRAGIAALLASFGTMRPVIWHVHDEMKRHPLSTAIRFLVLFSKRCRIIAVSNATAASFAGRLLKTSGIAVIHNAVDLKKIDSIRSGRDLRLKLGFGTEDFIFGAVGQITPRKGQLEVIVAFAKVAKQISAIKLVIVGAPIFNNDHLYQLKLEEAVKALGIEDKVIFLGQRSDAIAIIKEIDALIINSRSEAFVMVAIEAMACRTPVIATDVGGTREMIEHQYNGLLVNFGDEGQLIAAMITVHKNERLREFFKDRSREKVEKLLNAKRFTRKFQVILIETTIPLLSPRVQSQLSADA